MLNFLLGVTMPSWLVVHNALYLAQRIRESTLPSLRTFSNIVTRDVLSGFEGLEDRADAVAEAEYERLGQYDWEGDPSVAAEAANEAGINFYLMMSEFRQGTINLLAVGLFHLIEQQLQYISTDGLFNGLPPLNDTKISKIETWYQSNLGIDFRSYEGWGVISGELRLIANTIKHGDGLSATKLRELNPDLFEHPSYPRSDQPEWLRELPPRRIDMPLTGNGIYVTEERLDKYAATALHVMEAFAEDMKSQVANKSFPI